MHVTRRTAPFQTRSLLMLLAVTFGLAGCQTTPEILPMPAATTTPTPSSALLVLPEGWQKTLPADLRTLPVSPWQTTLEAPDTAGPLLPITVTLTIPGYNGPAELRLYDGKGRPAGIWATQVRDGAATPVVEGRGALGKQTAVLLIDGRVAGVNAGLFELQAETTLQTGQPRFDELYPRVRAFMEQDVTEYMLDGTHVRGYRSPDNNLLWLRDHTYQAQGFRYFERDMTSLIDAFRYAQRPDGSFPDYLARPEFHVQAGRKQVEADVEYLFVQAVYAAWQATGDDAWLRQNLDAMRRAVRYTMSNPLRWDSAHQLVKRPFTIDTWDFEYGPTTTDPTNGRPAPRHWIDERTIWGIFHGDNTGLADALRLLARIEERMGDRSQAEYWWSEADGIMTRLNKLSWNGSFFTHQVHLMPFSAPGVDEARQLSLSNAIALNRNVLSDKQARAIITEYYQRNQRRGSAFAEWYSIDPPFPPGSFGLAGNPGEQPGEYVNGGIMPLVGGELARGAFRYGFERYGFDILARYHFLLASTNASYLWYYPAGNPGKSSVDTLPTDGWGASAILAALLEGAAGVEDTGARYADTRLSPRWLYADDVESVRVVARYAASDGYVAYRWRRAPNRQTLDITGSGEHVLARLPLPEGVKQVAAVRLNGQAHTYAIEEVHGSLYVTLDMTGGGTVEIAW